MKNSHTLIAIICFVLSNISPDLSRGQPRSESVTTQAGRAGAVGNVGDFLTEAAPFVSDPAMDSAARVRLSELWGEVADRYRFLGNRGLLVEVQIGILKASAPTPVPIPKLLQVFVRGSGSDPVHAWAESQVNRPPKGEDAFFDSDYLVSKDDSWFWWITPSRRGWPSNAPRFEDAAGLLDRKTGYNSVVTPGITIRSHLLADKTLSQAAALNELENIARAAKANADTDEMRDAAAKLEKSASNALVRLTTINEQTGAI
jgi:hypothetical protein